MLNSSVASLRAYNEGQTEVAYEREFRPMEQKEFELKLPVNFSDLEAAVLEYLYNHPGESAGTEALFETLKPEHDTPEKREQAYQEFRDVVETLYADRLLKGKRISSASGVCFAQLSLTRKGESETIKERRRRRGVVLEVHYGDT